MMSPTWASVDQRSSSAGDSGGDGASSRLETPTSPVLLTSHGALIAPVDGAQGSDRPVCDARPGSGAR